MIIVLIAIRKRLEGKFLSMDTSYFLFPFLTRVSLLRVVPSVIA